MTVTIRKSGKELVLQGVQIIEHYALNILSLRTLHPIPTALRSSVRELGALVNDEGDTVQLSLLKSVEIGVSS